ncbi:MAG TPA: DUF3726 domain-containing protein [Dongiaceae bacterium]|nr:DUF3726 domain-containing protein [Dongiaceae bacterium]
MRPSLNEIEIESRKAARGAGLAWGLAEEAGHAIAWLAERGVNALPALLETLDASQNGDNFGDPLLAGTMIADRAQMLAEGEVFAYLQIRWPVLILPFMAMAARLTGRSIVLQHEDGVWSVRPGREDAGLLVAAVKKPRIVAVKCRAEELPLREAVETPPAMRLEIDDRTWESLELLAHRTYVPASEESRRLGAGAGSGIDND